LFRILVVDAEPDLRYIMRTIFERAGHAVLDADHPVAALDVVHQSPPDLVVIDMMMPMGDGGELIRRLRADPVTAPIPIVVATTNIPSACGADVVLTKQWNKRQLLEVTNALLVQKAGARGLA